MIFKGPPPISQRGEILPKCEICLTSRVVLGIAVLHTDEEKQPKSSSFAAKLRWRIFWTSIKSTLAIFRNTFGHTAIKPANILFKCCHDLL